MNGWTYIRRGLRHYARSHLALLLGTALAGAVLTGALWVGDSVRLSLRNMALARLGATHYALATTDRFFQADLAARLAAPGASPPVAALRLTGVASRADSTARVNGAQVLGVAEEFWRLAPRPPTGWPTGDTGAVASTTVAINARLAAQLRVGIGDAIVLRIAKPSPLSREAPIAPQEDASSAQRFTVGHILTAAQLGNFDLQASQIPPYNVFLPMATLARLAETPRQANLLLVGGADGAAASPAATADGPLAALRQTLADRWSLTDAQLELRPVPTQQVIELRTPRVFLDDAVARAARLPAPPSAGLLTYFVNELRAGTNATPYSTVCATDQDWLPRDLREDEMMVSQWLAEDLGLQTGATVEMKYYVVGDRRNLEEKGASFKVRGVLPAQGPWADPQLMPDFPGLSRAENCRDWDAGFAIQLDRIRPKDQTYWDQHRGTPKAFVTLAAGQRLWASRFGSLTAVRYPLSAGVAVSNELRRVLPPAQFGLVFAPVRSEALAASAQGQDFGQLFLGFSFFVLVAALILTVLLFHFAVEQRAAEVGLLLAVGLPPRLVRRLLLLEGVCVAAVGSALGVWWGHYYASLLVRGLTTLWQAAVNTPALEFHGTLQSGLIGGVANLALSTFTLWRAAGRQTRRPAHWLLTASREWGETGEKPSSRLTLWLALACGAGALGGMGGGLAEPKLAGPMFFLAGGCLVAGGLLLFGRALRSLAVRSARPSLRLIALKNLTRRARRSVAVAAMLALGTFIVAAIGVNRLETGRDATQRTSGTGGFTLLAQSALPVVHDLNTAAGRDFLSLDSTLLRDTRTVPFRVHDGDDASCLNLNRAQRPRVLGVNPSELASRQAFAFASLPRGTTVSNAWLALDRPEPDGSIPAIGDAASIQWALGKAIGDTLTLQDERGQSFQIKLVGAVGNSILQGNLVISEKAFLAKYPSESGSRWFLLDVPPGQVEAVASHLSRTLQDCGFETGSTLERLALLNAVQNTYLSTFQVLGGLGLLIGTIGMGLVVARNVLERRHEWALLHALGFRPGQVRALVLWEHAFLFLAGAAVGLFCALVAIVPNLISGGAPPPYRMLALILGAVLGSGLLWTWLATRWALRQEWQTALREE